MPSDDVHGVVAGRYSLIRRLGAGAQGVTWLVQDIVHPGRQLVLKAAPRIIEAAGSISREFEMLTRLGARHIVPIYDLGFVTAAELDTIPPLRDELRDGQDMTLQSVSWAGSTGEQAAGAIFLTRDYVDGEPVHTWASTLEAPHRQAAVADVALQIALAVSAAHRAELAHGDIKPDNVLVTSHEDAAEVWVIDFGLGLEASDASKGIAGTPHYMAPELWRVLREGAPVPTDHRPADIYALGVMLYELVSGRRPFLGARLTEVADAHLGPRPPLLDTQDKRLAGVISRMLTDDPAQRPTIRQVIDALGEFAGSGQPIDLDRQVQLPFLGRHELLDQILAELENGDDIAVLGEVGSGKTRLLDQVRWQLELQGTAVAEFSAATAEPWLPIRRLGEQFAARSQRQRRFPAQGGQTGDQSRLFTQLSSYLEHMAPELRIVVFWDGCDLAAEDLQRWFAHFRERRSTSSIQWVIAGRGGTWMDHLAPTSQHGPLRRHLLQPLPWDAVQPWARRYLQETNAPPSQLARLRESFERCDGHPLLFAEALAGRIDPTQGAASGPSDALDMIGWLGQRASALPLDRRRVALLVATSPTPVSLAALELLWGDVAQLLALPPTTDLVGAMRDLHSQGLVRIQSLVPRRWQARWGFLARLLGQSLGNQERGAIALAVARRLGAEHLPRQMALLLEASAHLEAPPPDVAAELHTAIADGWRDALKTLLDAGAWGQCVDLLMPLLAHGPSLNQADIAAELAEAAVAAGRAPEALQAVEAALQRADTPPSLGLHRARLLVACGRLKDAGMALDAMRTGDDPLEAPSMLSVPDQAEWYRRSAEVALRQGRFDDSAAMTSHGLSLLGAEEHLALRAQLGMVRGAAATFLGDSDALQYLADAQSALLAAGESGKSAARLHTFRAMALSRNGDLDEAADAYRRALEEAERAGLDSELPTYLLNVGTAYHRQGRFGLAREYYARGARVASTNTRPATRARLLGNQASIDIELGRTGEARELLREAAEALQGSELPLVEAYVKQLGADVDALVGAHVSARETFAELATVYRTHGNRREFAEVQLKDAHVALADGDLQEAQRAVDVARDEIEAGEFADLHARQGILRARILLAGGGLEAMTGIDLFRQSLLQSAEAGDHLVVLRSAPHLLDVLQREGMTELTAEVTQWVQDAWNAVAVGLTRQLRADFLSHLPRLPIALDVAPTERRPVPAPAGAVSSAATPARALVSRTLSPEELGLQSVRPSRSIQLAGQSIAIRTSPEDSIEKLYQLLSLNARIINEPTLDRLLPAAMDIALSLSGAERGFLLLDDPEAGRAGEFRVAISRDVDGEAIARPHLKVSLTIARQVAASGELVLTGHATRDPRFDAARSVRHLELTSVLCIPVRARERVLGTLYLDHRFRHDVFDGAVARMMTAFADQLALAILGARRLQSLQSEQRALQAAQTRIEDLLAEKESMLEDLETRCATLTREVEENRAVLSLRYRYDNVIAASPAMRRVLEMVDRVVDNTIPVVVLGESGTGKEVIARAIHANGPRAARPFVAFNCGAISENLIESELFGYVKGAFTGADRDRDGLFVAANRGTIFLDELGEMPASMQVKLLRALQERVVRPVGAAVERPIDVRVIAATNRDLREMVDDGTFREDLFYRLAGLVIELPPLRDRTGDVPLLVQHFLERVAADEDVAPRGITNDALNLLTQARWKGNVRHLENVIRTASVMTRSEAIGVEDVAHLVGEVRHVPSGGTGARRGRRPKATRFDVVEAMREASDDRAEAARILGVSERTLYRYLARFGLH